MWSCTWAALLLHPLLSQLFLCGIIFPWRDEAGARHGTHAEETEDTRLSLREDYLEMFEFATHRRSLPSEACSKSPKGCVQRALPPLQILAASLCRQVSKKRLIVECLWPEGDPTSQSFDVPLTSSERLGPGPVRGGFRCCTDELQTAVTAFFCILKVKHCDRNGGFYTDIKSWIRYGGHRWQSVSFPYRDMPCLFWCLYIRGVSLRLDLIRSSIHRPKNRIQK